MNSRGISPLIATVLLMAFAVALGGMIMNWSAKPIVLGCDKIAIETNQFCRGERAIALTIQNTGEEEIAQIALKLKNGEDVFEVTVPDSKIALGQTLRKQVPVLLKMAKTAETPDAKAKVRQKLEQSLTMLEPGNDDNAALISEIKRTLANL